MPPCRHRFNHFFYLADFDFTDGQTAQRGENVLFQTVPYTGGVIACQSRFTVFVPFGGDVPKGITDSGLPFAFFLLLGFAGVLPRYKQAAGVFGGLAGFYQ